MILTEPRWKSYIVTSTDPIFSLEQCEDIIRVGKSLPQEDAKTDSVKNKKGIKNYKIRKTDISWIPFNKMPAMYQSLENWGAKVNNNHFGFDGIQLGEPAQFTQYSKEKHYDWHTDSAFEFSKQPFVRKISMSVLLNNPKDFKGGELQLIDNKKILSLKQGYGVFFASFIAHRVLPVKKGNRISMVTWFNGPSLK